MWFHLVHLVLSFFPGHHREDAPVYVRAANLLGSLMDSKINESFLGFPFFSFIVGTFESADESDLFAGRIKSGKWMLFKILAG